MSRSVVPDTQLEKFQKAARELECDDDEKRFDAKLKKLVKPQPQPKGGTH